MFLVWLVAWLGLLVPSLSASRKYLNYSGDIMLGALFPIHHKGSGKVDCGKIQVSFLSHVLRKQSFTRVFLLCLQCMLFLVSSRQSNNTRCVGLFALD
jgi:hypothetical protein